MQAVRLPAFLVGAACAALTHTSANALPDRNHCQVNLCTFKTDCMGTEICEIADCPEKTLTVDVTSSEGKMVLTAVSPISEGTFPLGEILIDQERSTATTLLAYERGEDFVSTAALSGSESNSTSSFQMTDQRNMKHSIITVLSGVCEETN